MCRDETAHDEKQDASASDSTIPSKICLTRHARKPIEERHAMALQDESYQSD